MSDSHSYHVAKADNVESLYDSAFEVKNESYSPSVDQHSDQDKGSATSSDHVEGKKL